MNKTFDIKNTSFITIEGQYTKEVRQLITKLNPILKDLGIELDIADVYTYWFDIAIKNIK
jgi:hypothetical protein